MDQLHKKPSHDYPHQQVSAAAAVSSSSSSSTTTTGGSDDRIVSLDSYLKIRDNIVEESLKDGQTACGITGMAGIGKTTFAKKLFTDSLVKETFECRAFLTLGQKNYDLKQILQAIVAQLNVDDEMMVMRGDENIYQYFKRSVSGRKFLIVLDDLWSIDGNFERRLKGLLLAEKCNGTLLVTSRNEISLMARDYMISYMMSLLNEEQSWELLQLKVFGEGGCPTQLVKPGKKIAEKCDGLPLLIVTVAEHLLRSPISLEHWNEVAEMKSHSLFEDAINDIYEVILPSYHHLNQHLKAFFLYMGVFPINYVIRSSRITQLWRAERFAYGFDSDSILDGLVSDNLVVIREKRFCSWDELKGCNLHVVYRHVSKREGENDKFISILDSYVADGSIGARMKDKRLLAIHHNTLLAIKEIYDSIASLSTLRSLLCTGPYHQYQVPISCFELRMLRVLDALTICFYEFPVEVVKLIQLKYLSLTTNTNLSPSISKLWFLQCLIIHQHLIIKSTLAESYVPVEIWELKELENLQIVGRNLPHPPPGTILPKLTRLLDVGAQTCVKGVLESLPNLEKLRVQIELVPQAGAQPQPMNCFDHIVCLKNLASLQSVIINPYLLHSNIIPPRLSSNCFRSMKSITKMSLSGFGYPWKDMSKISEIPYLKSLKLKGYAFRGEKWEAEEMRFLRLWDLVIEDTNLERWTATAESFPSLNNITLENCHKLKEIPMMEYTNIKLVDCNPIVEGWLP